MWRCAAYDASRARHDVLSPDSQSHDGTGSSSVFSTLFFFVSRSQNKQYGGVARAMVVVKGQDDGARKRDSSLGNRRARMLFISAATEFVPWANRELTT